MKAFELFTRNTLLAGAAMMAFAASTAAAQTADPLEAEAAPGEIVVTAQKRAERLQDVPASVAVLNTADLTKQGIVRFEDYAAKIPGLSITSGRTGQTSVTLRGITTGAAQPGSTTGFYIDEAPIGSVNAYTGGNANTPDLDPSDLAQIEVLKGPQGTLYGAGAVGGLLKFVTSKPEFENITGRVSGGVTNAAKGNTGYAIRGMINIPLVKDGLVIRASAFDRRDVGFVDNIHPRLADKDINGAHVRGWRGQLAANLGPDVTLSIQGIGQDTWTDGSTAVDIDAVTLRPVYGDLKQRRAYRENGKIQFRLYNATLKADLGPVQLTSATTFQHQRTQVRSDATNGYGAALGGIGVGSQQTYRTERWVQELRADATGLAGGLFDAQLGYYYTTEDDVNRIPGFETFNPATGAALPLPQLAVASIVSDYAEHSVFGNVTLHLGDRFDLLGGVRYSHDKQNYKQRYAGALIPGGLFVNTGIEKGDVFTYLVSPRFRFTPNSMVYGRVATGYRPGGPNAAPPALGAPTTFDPDKLTSYELGYKGSFADRKVTLDAALFLTNWDDVQIQTSQAGFQYLVNGGTARSKGAEVTVTIVPARGLNFGLTAAYTDAKLTDPAPAAGGVKGDRLPYVPRWSGALNAEYRTPVFGDFEGFVGGSINYTGQRYSDYTNRFRKDLPAFTRIDLRAGIDNGDYSLSIFAKNLTDERAFLVVAPQGLAPSNTAGQLYSGAVIQPRVIGAEAAIRF